MSPDWLEGRLEDIAATLNRLEQKLDELIEDLTEPSDDDPPPWNVWEER